MQSAHSNTLPKAPKSFPVNHLYTTYILLQQQSAAVTVTQNIPGSRLHAARKTPDALGQGQGAHKGCRSRLPQVYIHKHVCVCAYAVYIECTDSEIRSLESRTNIQRRFGGEP